MLKITFDSDTGKPRWVLSGKLCGPWVGELRSMWERVCGSTKRTEFTVDLSEVTAVDDQGETLLRSMSDAGAHFVARGVCMKHLISELTAGAKPALRKWLAHPWRH